MVGKFAKSKAGHDKDQIYVIIKEDGEYVYLADGRLKTIDKPKKKKRKHIQPILKYEDEISQKLINNRQVTDAEIKASIKNCFR